MVKKIVLSYVSYHYHIFTDWWLHNMIYENYDYIYIRLNEISKNEIIKFPNFISNIISKLLKNVSFFVIIGNIISLVRIWLVLSLKFILLYVIVDYRFN